MTKEEVKAQIKPLYNTILVRLIMETGELIKGSGLVKPDSQLKIEPYVEIMAVGPIGAQDATGTVKEAVMKVGDYALIKGRCQINVFRLGKEDYAFVSEYDLDAIISEEVAMEISSTTAAKKLSTNSNLNIVN